MRRLAFVAALVTFVATPSLGADLEEAERLLGKQPEKSLALVREALAADPHDAKAHAVGVRALRLLGRSTEAVSPLEAWAAEAPGDLRPLWILLDVHVGLRDWASVATLPARASAAPEDLRREFLRTITLAQLENERYEDARSNLAATPPPKERDPSADLFVALASSAAGDLGPAARALERYLVSGVDDRAQEQILWWSSELAGKAYDEIKEKSSPAEGFLAGEGAGGPAVLPTGKIALPTLRRKARPEYPDAARRARIEGKVTLETVVLTTGHVAFPRVLASTNPVFNDSARRAMVRWRYTPASKDGRPVAVYYVVSVKYML